MIRKIINLWFSIGYSLVSILILVSICTFFSVTVSAQSHDVESTDKTIAINTPQANHTTVKTSNENSVTVEEIAVITKESTDNAIKQLAKQEVKQSKPEVGKHVMANMDVTSMALSLLMVLAVIVAFALVMKRFNLAPQKVSQLKMVASLNLGAKEKVVVVQVGDQQLLIGVASQQITLLDKLDRPLTEQNLTTASLPNGVLSFLSAKKA